MSNLKKSERTRQEILDTAWKLISEQGADISLSKIADAVGMTRQSVYVHFGSRGGLLVALVKRADDREKIFQAFDTAMLHSEAEERFNACLDAWFDFVPKILPVARDLIRLRSKDAEAEVAWSGRMQELREFYITLMESIHKDGKLNPAFTPGKAAHYFWTQSSVQVWQLLTEDCGWSEQDTINSIKSSLSATLLKSA